MVMGQKPSFTIIVPTHTGQEHIEKCLKAIQSQRDKGLLYEVIVVIDGQNEQIKEIVDSQKKHFSELEVSFEVHQSKTNEGRFYARKKGAELSNSEQLLFIDDRVTITQDFLANITNLNQEIVMPSIVEKDHPNIISRLMYLVRKKIYGSNNWGVDFKPYYINKDNFEKSSKGTTTLWIRKKAFVKACSQMEKIYPGSDMKNSSDDTKLLKLIIEDGNQILRTSKVIAFYNPRTSFVTELNHIYQRGPRFVDYYLMPGTRFWFIFPAALIGLILSIVLIVMFGLNGLIGLTVCAVLSISMASVYLGENPKDILTNVFLLPLIVVAFGLGVLKGLVLKVVH